VNDDLPGRFKRVYFHLYSNSNASRAEVLLADLSLLLLVKLVAERAGASALVTSFVSGRGEANEVLLPLLRRAYPRLVDASDRFRVDDASLRHALAEIEGVRLAESAAHVLGEAFQALIGPRIRGDKGQFFTPRSLVRAMVTIVAPQPGESILDPACGTGGFLYEALAHLEGKGGEPLHLHGADKDRDLARFAAALLAYRSPTSVVANVNSLRLAEWPDASVGDGYDVVLTNPPFGARIPIREEAVLSAYELARQWRFDEGRQRWVPTGSRVSSQDPQVLFLELCIRKLRPGGRMAIVLPEGLFGNRKEAHVWDFVRSQGEIVGLLDCPRTTFQPGTDTKTNVLFFRKGRADEGAATAVAVALSCGHDRRGRTQRSDGSPYPDDLAELSQGFTLIPGRRPGVRRDEPGYPPSPPPRAEAPRWRWVQVANPYYLVPRYYVEETPTSASEARVVAGARWASLGELVEAGLLEIRKGHEVGSEAYGTGDVPFVRTSDVANFEVSADPTKSVSEEIYEQYAPQQRLGAGSILMVADGRYRIGATAILTRRSARCVAQSHLRILDTRSPEELDPHALLFSLNLPSVRRRIRDLVFVQSTLGTLGSRIFELRIPLLQGSGAWADTVARFREALQRRDALLGALDEMVEPEIEL
jgi:type I restriction enzyme M protein